MPKPTTRSAYTTRAVTPCEVARKMCRRPLCPSSSPGVGNVHVHAAGRVVVTNILANRMLEVARIRAVFLDVVLGPVVDRLLGGHPVVRCPFLCARPNEARRHNRRTRLRGHLLLVELPRGAVGASSAALDVGRQNGDPGEDRQVDGAEREENHAVALEAPALQGPSEAHGGAQGAHALPQGLQGHAHAVHRGAVPAGHGVVDAGDDDGAEHGDAGVRHGVKGRR
mmetsp:Transcript_23303/g.65494  ORF Transcript_23303/g.65494 Transcript_23303/m.65494 type:complete len:225 (-) Transcript_23303:89-763(-)